MLLLFYCYCYCHLLLLLNLDKESTVEEGLSSEIPETSPDDIHFKNIMPHIDDNIWKSSVVPEEDNERENENFSLENFNNVDPLLTLPNEIDMNKMPDIIDKEDDDDNEGNCKFFLSHFKKSLNFYSLTDTVANLIFRSL